MEDSRQALNRDDAAAQILLDGLTDWVALDMAQQYVRDRYPSKTRSQLRDRTLSVVTWLLDRRLVVAGELRPDFVAWDLGPGPSSERIAELWTDPDAALRPGDVCWLATTPEGDRLADRLHRGDPTEA